jgi:hypothetical protein
MPDSPAETHQTPYYIAVLRNYVDAIEARHGYSQRAQAEVLGVDWTTFRDWLNGNAKWPKSAQMALENWASSALAEDNDGLAALAAQGGISLSLDDERALIAAWRRVRSDDESYNLASTVPDWPLESLLAFAREGYRDPGFQESVQAQLLDNEGETLPLPGWGTSTLYHKAAEWCTPSVLERLADLLDV